MKILDEQFDFTTCRSDFDRLIEHRGLNDSTHRPYLVITKNSVLIVNKVKTLVTYPDDTIVIQQWPGEWRSDFIKFTVGQAKEALTNLPDYKHD